MPILYMLGRSSPDSAHAVADVLLPHLRGAEVVEFPGPGHMAPVTHPEVIHAEIARFLGKV
jgi:pimeloyl-ACP methyl ester carboxylesterase